MPINKKLYHPAFKKLSQACLEQANYLCQECGIRQGTERISERGNTFKEQIHAHHINHDPWNPCPELIALCTRCHLKADASLRGRNGRRTKLRKKRLAMIQAGQLELPWELQ